MELEGVVWFEECFRTWKDYSARGASVYLRVPRDTVIETTATRSVSVCSSSLEFLILRFKSKVPVLGDSLFISTTMQSMLEHGWNPFLKIPGSLTLSILNSEMKCGTHLKSSATELNCKLTIESLPGELCRMVAVWLWLK